jgi:hypothetical protein
MTGEANTPKDSLYLYTANNKETREHTGSLAAVESI